MAISRSVKMTFEAERGKYREKEIKWGVDKHFYTCNDNFSLADILEKPAESKLEKNSIKIVNLMVAESDIFSILHLLEGGVIICDIDRRLLLFLEQQKDFLLDLYEQLNKEIIKFDKIIYKYSLWFSRWNEEPHFKNRMELLGDKHFLYNEQNFKNAMIALKANPFVTLDINLFCKNEQNTLCAVLKKFDVKVKRFNLTNLPDYDGRDCLPSFLENIPWAPDYQIIWNIHDRGAMEEFDLNTHYFFMTSNVSVYSEHVAIKPKLFAEIDSAIFSSSNKFIDPSLLQRYSLDYSYQKKDNNTKRLIYLQHLKKSHFSSDKKDQTFETLSQHICSRYHIPFPPRDFLTINFFWDLSKYRIKLIDIKKTIIIKNKETHEHLIKLIDQGLDKIENAKITIDFRIKDKRNEMENMIAILLFQINSLQKFVKIVENIQTRINRQYSKIKQKPIADEINSLLKSILDDVHVRLDHFKYSDSQRQFLTDTIAKIQEHKFIDPLLHFQKKSIIYSFSAFLAPSTKRKDSNIPIQRSDETKSQKKELMPSTGYNFFNSPGSICAVAAITTLTIAVAASKLR